MNILILGSNGMAGHVIYKYLSKELPNTNVTTLARNNADICCDIINQKDLFCSIDFSKYDWIINCIGVLVKEANDNPEKAMLINAWLPKYLEAKTIDTNTKIIHLSTDCVFSGKRGLYSELCEKDAIDFYGISKSLGEINNQKDLTIRTSIIGPEIKENGTGLFHWFINQKEPINGYSNVFWNGITTIELAKIIKLCINQSFSKFYGLVNIPSEIVSKKELLSILNEEFSKGIEIRDIDYIRSNKTLSSIYNPFKIKSHKQMLKEMREWIESNKELYPKY